ncbi:sigma 54 modulation/S30EA ribosomal C-terminal domain-containing protein [Nocardia sp. alder85J]|uniref:sigma 54 modulation/S30EA ribosomal C-terminal domain-containing protein n=1 Tax=Nocardia sp. alder85J TaxID=2862949 RepID=UPI001CD7F7C9|nr:sigma 54 modulation/S30EA ribosomal C-terminal domain-containing protein [Nocardia sp. alder85J]MCX4092449.1 sigma 54 modulation/S30EA ribosomal C-terminal domain-containing protein [Nocardia sp. alder85J]
MTNVECQISADQHVSAAAADYAREKIGHALRCTPEPVLSAHVRLTGHRDPAVAKPVVAHVNVNVNGHPVQARTEAATSREAVDLLAARLTARLSRLPRHGDTARGGHDQHAAHEWRHSDPRREPLPYFPRPVEQREVYRHAAFPPVPQLCDEAALDMDLMDYEFHLFTESGSGIDSVLYRTTTGLRLAQANPRPDTIIRGDVDLDTDTGAAPVLSEAAAIARLELSGRPFVFFIDPDSGRGRLLYHRYDGHYGLLTAAVAPGGSGAGQR